eukprot:gnl/TRDRNA2_/TRDRNA2_182791_c0_seq1.p1 gnl/TRDRNA2_/TRDRNA2_182791_c0~~gnl/TRDRNA2_/TRDRNA2_182791_c0_seq1.p1  ORF type:complete len:322 (-),score=36.18 gnl/TRDRNA2_/TRDRNA2_182791_c0_seq1:196-1161(-)
MATDKCSHAGAKEFLSGGAASCVAKTCVAPFSRVTILMQTQLVKHGKTTSPFDIIWDIRQQEGIVGFWRGNTATVAQRFMMSGITFAVAGACKRKMEKFVVPHAWHPLACSLAASTFASCISVVVTQPLDVVKTRLMTHPRGDRSYEGIVGAFRTIVREEGFPGLQRGVGIAVAGAVPTIAVNFALYDLFMGRCRKVGTASRNLEAGKGARPPAIQKVLFCGFAAGVCSSTLFFPIDLVKRQMHLSGTRGCAAAYSGALDAIQKIYQSGARTAAGGSRADTTTVFRGLREFYRGLLPELVKVGPGVAIMFAVNECLLVLME